MKTINQNFKNILKNQHLLFKNQILIHQIVIIVIEKIS